MLGQYRWPPWPDLAARGVPHVSVHALTPYYVANLLQPDAMIAFVESIDGALGTSTNVDALREQAGTVRKAADEAVRQSEQLREVVCNLEQQYDFIRGSSSLRLPAPRREPDLPDAAQLMAQVDDFLRRRNDPGGQKSAGGGAART